MSRFDAKVETETRPPKLQDKHLKYLDVLRGTGVTNMWGAQPWLKNAFPRLTNDEASKILDYWMRTFADRLERGEVSK